MIGERLKISSYIVLDSRFWVVFRTVEIASCSESSITLGAPADPGVPLPTNTTGVQYGRLDHQVRRRNNV